MIFDCFLLSIFVKIVYCVWKYVSCQSFIIMIIPALSVFFFLSLGKNLQSNNERIYGLISADPILY